MDIQELEAFWWVAQTGSFNRAADRLYLTQPSVTARIQALEKELGQILFERKPRGVRLTDAGKILLPHVEKILLDLKQARQAVNDYQAAHGGTLTIGSALSSSTYVMPQLLTEFRQSHPAVDVIVRSGKSHEIQQMVLDDLVQMAFAHTPLASHPDITAVPLFEEESVLVASPTHALTQKSAVTPEELAGVALITGNRNSTYWAVVEQYLFGLGVVLQVNMEMDSLDAAKEMVLSGLGVSMLPYGLIEDNLNEGSLRSIPLQAPPLARHTVLLFRRRKIWSGVTEAFLRTLAGHFRVDLVERAIV